MQFTHLIEINDPMLPLFDVLTREQLWRGLVLRAEAPALFVPHLDECTISAREQDRFERALRYGEIMIRDVVTLKPQHAVHYAVPAQKDIAASTLSMTIEEPQPGALFVRFGYDDQLPEASGVDAFYDSFRRSAYEESDIDTIRIIRQMAQEGGLPSLV